MLRKLAIIVLFMFIIFNFTYALLYYSFNIKPEGNTVNFLYRKMFLSQPLLKSIFRLNQIGDSRFDLATDKNYSKLKLEVFLEEREQLLSNTLKLASLEMQKVINKPQGISVTEQILTESLPDSISDKDLQELIKTHPPTKNSHTAVVQIFVLRKYGPKPTYAGLVSNATSIFLFMDAIRNVSLEQQSTENMEVSTVLHEFGHLLGAEHVDEDNCILSKNVEDLTVNNLPEIFVTSYCQADIYEIERQIKP